MGFITLANTNKIIFNSDFKNLDLKGDIYKIPIYFFSKYEKNSLLAIQELLKDPEKYFSEIYKPYKPIDTFTYVYEGQNPSYHQFSCCPRLLSNYQNFEVPQEIQDNGIDAVQEFRQWFESVKHLLDKPDIFVERLRIKYGIITNPKAINKENSGSTIIENMTIEELKNVIDSLIVKAGHFHKRDEKHTAILNRFSKYTYIAYKSDRIFNNETGYRDDEVKDLLKSYDEEFKRPLKRMLIEYYRLKLNPEIKMEDHFLDLLGFEPCKYCHHLDYIPKNIEYALRNDNNNDWSFVDQNIEFFRTMYSIHYPFSLREIKSCYNILSIGYVYNSCFEVEEGWVRDCPASWGFCFNQNISWDKSLKELWLEVIGRYKGSPEKFPLSIDVEFEYYFKYHRNSFLAYVEAVNYMKQDIPPEAFEDDQGEIDFDAYGAWYAATLKREELEFNKKIAAAELLDATYKVDFYNFDQSDHKLLYFIRTFYSRENFEIFKFIFDETVFERVEEYINGKLPNFKVEDLFNRNLIRI